MNVTNPIANRVLDRLQSANGQIFSVADFLDLGPRPTVDQSRRRLDATINGGGPTIRVETTNGGIRVRGK